MGVELSVEVEAELELAETARFAGNEGRARVCARRAAGSACRVFLALHGIKIRTGSAYEALQVVAKYPGLAPELKQAAHNLIKRVNEDFIFPVNIDLIAEARRLIGGLQ